MFANLGWGEVLVLLVIGLVVLGPERLPGAIRWTSGALRQARDYLNSATAQIREDIGPEFDDLREPLGEINKLRGMSPRAALTKHLLDGDDSFLTGDFGARPGSADADRDAPAAPSAPAPDAAPAQPRFDTDAT